MLSEETFTAFLQRQEKLHGGTPVGNKGQKFRFSFIYCCSNCLVSLLFNSSFHVFFVFISFLKKMYRNACTALTLDVIVHRVTRTGSNILLQ